MTVDPADAYDELVARFVDRPGVGTGRMLSAQGLSYRGKYFAMLYRQSGLGLKLPAARVAELRTEAVGLPFESGQGRVMREWVVIPPDHDDRWEGLADEALAFAQRNAGSG
jgi:hypothetical protein